MCLDFILTFNYPKIQSINHKELFLKVKKIIFLRIIS